jgi:hypothetical protein
METATKVQFYVEDWAQCQRSHRHGPFDTRQAAQQFAIALAAAGKVEGTIRIEAVPLDEEDDD